MRRYRSVVIWLAGGFLAGLVLSGCIRSRCYQNLDCGKGQVCDRVLGECIVPECHADLPCPEGFYCENFRCAAGCAKDDDCQKGEKCIGARCLPFREECNCLAATDFCLADRNPNSASYLQKVCVSDHKQSGVALFFGSVGCPHCWTLYGQVREMQQELTGQGYSPSLVFVNIKSVDATPEKIAKGMSDVTTPIVQDGEQVGIWDAYLADWYHLVLVDQSGCIAAHFGPLSSQGLEGEEGTQVFAAWKQAMEAQCTPAEPDVRGDGFSDGVSDVPDGFGDADGATESSPDPGSGPDVGEADGGTPPEVDVAELVDAAAEADDGSDSGEGGGGDDVPPFELAEVCQVVQTAPVPLGGPVPYFLCMDRNSSSAGYLKGFSPPLLSEKVWIAYFGACT
ncbi:MAG: hypothetical protein FJ109_18830 [Deltaproteobacteria bacterium]|nr:hypothetical protein [Deltaproteobacteria bacterium]